MNRNNPLKIAMWTMLSSFGLTVVMTIPNLDSTRALLLAGHLDEAGKQVSPIDGKSELTGSVSKALNPIESETTQSSVSLPVLLEPVTPDNATSHEEFVHDVAAGNVSTEEFVLTELEPITTEETDFDSARLESRLMELLEKVDRMEHFQIQHQMSLPDPSNYLLSQDKLSRQLEELESTLQAFSSHRPVEQSVTITPDSQKSVWKPTQSKKDQLSPERNQDEKSSDRISLPHIIPKGTPW